MKIQVIPKSPKIRLYTADKCSVCYSFLSYTLICIMSNRVDILKISRNTFLAVSTVALLFKPSICEGQRVIESWFKGRGSLKERGVKQ